MSKYKEQEKQPEIFQSREYKHSRAAYVGQETCNYFIHLLLVDAYLATLLSYLGISDAIIGIIASLVSFAFLLPFGRYSDRTSISRGYRLALVLVVISQTFYVFCAPRTWWLIIPGAVLYNISLAGSNSNNFNMTYSYVKAEYIVQAMAIKQSITGVIGFIAALIGGSILQGIQQNGNRFLGIPVYGQQLLCALSITFIVGAILFNKLVIEKQKRLIQ